MEAGRHGRHGDSAAQPAVRASSCASVLVTTLHPDTGAVCVWGRAGMRGEDNQMFFNKVTLINPKTAMIRCIFPIK